MGEREEGGEFWIWFRVRFVDLVYSEILVENKNF